MNDANLEYIATTSDDIEGQAATILAAIICIPMIITASCISKIKKAGENR